MTNALLTVLVAGTTLAPSATPQQECRFGSAERIVRCAAWKFEPPGGPPKALSVWRCESGWAYEGYHSDPYHGPFQYLEDTYDSQFASMPDVRRWFDTQPFVHDPRSNIITAIAWAARYGWGPWSCA